MNRVEVRPTGDTAEAIKAKAEQTQNEIKDLQAKLEVFKSSNRDALPPEYQNYLLQRDANQTQLVAANVELEKLRNEYASLQNQIKSDVSLRADPEDPRAKKLQELRAELASMMVTRRDTHPQVIDLKHQIADLEATLTTAPSEGHVSLSIPYRTIDLRIKEVRRQIDGFEKAIPFYQQELDRLNGNLKKMPLSEQTIDELTFQIKTRQEILAKLNQEQAGAMLSNTILTQVQDSRYITVSSPTTASAEPNAKFLLAAALASGLVLGLILAIIFELTDPIVYGPLNLKRKRDYPCLQLYQSEC